MRRGDRSLDGRHVLLTGAAGGIGRALARLLAKRGCHLTLVDRDGDGLAALQTALRVDGALSITTHTVDLRSRASIDSLVSALAGAPLDVLINNAGIAPGASFAAMDMAEIDAVFETNLMAVITLTHGLLPNLRRAGHAYIANVASAAGLLAPGGLAAYAASKFAVVGFSESLRAELAPQGVGVGAICPAFVRTDIIRNSRAGAPPPSVADTNRIDRLHSLVQRLGTSPERVAVAIAEAIEHNRARVVVGGLPRLLLAARVASPRLADWLNQKTYERLSRDDLLR